MSDDVRALDAARSRIAAVVKSLEVIDADLTRHDPLPNWPSLQKSSALLLRNITSLLQATTTHSDVLRSLHSYPLPKFPGQSQDGLLQSLLRKKREPSVDDWIIEGLGYASQFCDMGEFQEEISTSQTKDGLDEEAISELWEWAGPAENDIGRHLLNPQGSEEEDEEDEEDEDEDADIAMKDAEPPRLPLATVLTFMSTGAVPKVVDREKEERDMQAAMKKLQAQRAAEDMDRRAGIKRV